LRTKVGLEEITTLTISKCGWDRSRRGRHQTGVRGRSATADRLKRRYRAGLSDVKRKEPSVRSSVFVIQ
jgi:hypothetical protein